MNESTIEFYVSQPGERLDKLVAVHLPDLSRTQVQAIIRSGQVTVDGEAVKPGVKLRGGEHIRVTLLEPVAPVVEAEVIDLAVVYEDDELAVIDKPAGMVVHPATGNESGTLVNALLARWPQIASMDDPDERHGERRGIVHRLDKDTSGLLVIAKTAGALRHLMAQFQARTVEKTYLALLERTPRTPSGRIEAPIGRDPKQRKRMAVLRSGKPAVTEFTVIDDDFRDGATLVEFNLLTGRTHQIRVHAAFINCPVIGDRVYGYRKQRIRMKRLFLHAHRLSFDHPTSDERLTFESPLPGGLRAVMDKLRT
ncbi:MAG: RluA family pseudouridine synthase [Phototrophicaceae bacterium]